MMAAAGFDTVFVGIETPDEDALAACNKKQNLGRDLVADVKRIQRPASRCTAASSWDSTATRRPPSSGRCEFIQRSGIVTAMVGLLQAPPGTRLHERMAAEGRLLGMTGDNVDGTTNVAPRMGLEALRDGYRALPQQIYSPGEYYRRVRTFLREVRVPVAHPRTDFRRVMALLHSAGELGMLRRERFHYWGLLGLDAHPPPRLLSQAVTLAIYGYHFRRVVELNIM